MLHHRFWPKGLPRSIHVPRTTLHHNLEVAAARYPDKAAIVFYDSILTYRQLKQEVEALAGYLRHRLGVGRGDRVILLSQNCPQ
ncbi:MAG: AMP-binding protein, partial [Gammaproteobacteria bacterium]|nr:AMP-binding protein [Gammaproteobacteria bacterium]